MVAWAFGIDAHDINEALLSQFLRWFVLGAAVCVALTATIITFAAVTRIKPVKPPKSVEPVQPTTPETMTVPDDLLRGHILETTARAAFDEGKAEVTPELNKMVRTVAALKAELDEFRSSTAGPQPPAINAPPEQLTTANRRS